MDAEEPLDSQALLAEVRRRNGRGRRAQRKARNRRAWAEGAVDAQLDLAAKVALPSGGSELRVSAGFENDRPVVRMRVWAEIGGDWRPTNRFVTLPLEVGLEAVGALTEGIKALQRQMED